MPICQGCKKSYDDSFAFCPYCGKETPKTVKVEIDEPEHAKLEQPKSVVVLKVVLGVIGAIIGFSVGSWVAFLIVTLGEGLNDFLGTVVMFIVIPLFSFLGVVLFVKQQKRLKTFIKKIQEKPDLDFSESNSQNLFLPIVIIVLLALLGYFLGPLIIYGEEADYLMITCSGSINYGWCTDLVLIRVAFSVLFGFFGGVIAKILIIK